MGFRVYGLKTSDDMVGDSQHEVLCTMATLQEGGRTLRLPGEQPSILTPYFILNPSTLPNYWVCKG